MSQLHALNTQFQLSRSLLPEDIASLVSEVSLRVKQRIAWLESLKENELNQQQYMFELDKPEHELIWRRSDSNPFRDELLKVIEARNANDGGRLNELSRLFGFAQEDTHLFELCVVAYLVPHIANLFSVIKSEPTNSVTELLVSRLYDYGYYYSIKSESPLIVWGILREGVTSHDEHYFKIDEHIMNWLMNDPGLHRLLTGRAAIVKSKPPLQKPTLEIFAEEIRQKLLTIKDCKLVIAVEGECRSGKKTIAAFLSEYLSFPLLAFNSFSASEPELKSIITLAHRQAYLDKVALYWSNQEFIQHASIPNFPIQFVGISPGESLVVSDSYTLVYYRIPELTIEQKEAIWRQSFKGFHSFNEDQRRSILSRRMSIGELHSEINAGEQDFDKLIQNINRRELNQFDRLAKPLNSEFTRDDLILKNSTLKQIDDFIFEAKVRDEFWENSKATRLFPRGTGLVVLLAGSPGSGKTMSAQVVANELNRPLYRVDLASVVSKYIGETSKHLSKLIEQAAESNIILFFDEADALFTNRTEVNDAHDRYANTDTNFLLQAIEDFPGVAILATNKKSNLDNAFVRRLRYVIDINEPDSLLRFQLWNKLSSEIFEVSNDRFKPFFKILSEQYALTGAQVKFILLSATFSARQQGTKVSAEHILKGLQRELLKTGRHLSEQEISILHRSARAV
ncbi:ATP-binding protein [Pleionea litopenaei]|uniref:AAA family ATPase n=1 Tax=Pleionea litopenaei TaxID=3070815 RepID=A0AA51X7E7_9GAMM|nr:AAA family ATPase [Pleionea sp. HL-JVS1]WMS87806.1 AAA family ATPase [Pleionea sp. HL-JVS1]